MEKRIWVRGKMSGEWKMEGWRDGGIEGQRDKETGRHGDWETGRP
jgi:hypothetical protein